jgi:ATP-dependent Lon protease
MDDKYKKKTKVIENVKEMNLSWKEEKDEDEVALNEMKEMLKEYKKGGKEKMASKLEKLIDAGEKEQKKKQKKKDQVVQRKNTTKLRKLLREKDVMNDFKYFSTMDVNKQKKIISELESINKVMNIEKPYRITLLETDIPIEFKADALKKVNLLSFMSPETGEYYKIKQWVDTFMRIPFGKHKNLPLSITDGPEKCSEFISNAKKTLDEAVYGLEDAKMQILQMIGQWIANPESVGTAIAIKGPMGTGKTTLVKEGVSKILNRPFAFLALGGATDSSFLEGHSYTYEGSSWGKIIDILIQCQCMNPVIYFDELDKVSDTPKGEEIINTFQIWTLI